MKLLLTVLVLIVLPTAWLSLLAGRSIQARELLLDRRLETEAQQTLEQVGQEVQHSVTAALTQIAALVENTLLTGSDMAHVSETLSDLTFDHAIVNNIYIFLDPWGFIYPERATPDHVGITDGDVLLAQELAMRLSHARRRLMFSLTDSVYVFQEVGENTRLLVGYSIQEHEFLALVERVLHLYSTAHIDYRLLRVGPVDAVAGRYEEPDLEVQDTFSLGPERLPATAAFMRDSRRRDILVSGHLRNPFGHIEIGALAVNARDMQTARALQARLVRWSIILLAFVLLTSAVILIVMGRRQAEAARIRSVFLAGLSHDIRTPVTAMRALAESLQHGRVTAPERKQQFLDSIVDECDRLQSLIERVLLFFRQEQRGRYQKKPIAIGPLCDRVLEAFCSRHRGRVDVTVDLPDGPLPELFADASALEQALHNLLENACKYGRPHPDHPDHVVPITVRVTTTPFCLWRRCIAIAVEDAGPGVPAGEQQRIFGRFYRSHSQFSQHAGGIGLGLALVWEIVRGHGGRVSVEKSPLGGARFVMRFRPYALRLRPWQMG